MAGIARRAFLIGSVAVAGGVAFGAWRLSRDWPNPLPGWTEHAVLGPHVVIDPEGVTVIAPRAEMGQGVQSTLAALAAEELDLDWDEVRVAHGPPSPAYWNGAIFAEGVPFAPTDTGWVAETGRALARVPAKAMGLQLTGGSSSMPDGFVTLRKAGAAARICLVEAAARMTGWPVERLATEAGAVTGPEGMRLPYPVLAEGAAAVPPPDDPPLRARSAWRLLGRSLPRLDMAAKCTGTAAYAIDTRLPGMLFATVRRAPHGQALRAAGTAEAAAMPGVEAVVPLPDGAAVVARSTWHAMRAADRIALELAPPPWPADTEGHRAAVDAAFDTDPETEYRNDGDVAPPSPTPRRA